MKRVLVKSVYDCFEYVMDHYYPAGLKHLAMKNDEYIIISIQDTHTKGFGLEFKENEFCKAVLTLHFDDLDAYEEGYKMFDENMALKIIDFVKVYSHVETLVVHCYAGQSRSSAVAAFIVKMLKADNSKYFTKYQPNMFVYQTLEKVWNNMF